MLGARYDLAIALDRDAAIREAELADQAGDRGARLDAPSFPVDDDVERPWHRAETSMRSKVSSDEDHDIRAVVMYEIVKHPSQVSEGRSAATCWNLVPKV
jgi:hypothetical protein